MHWITKSIGILPAFTFILIASCNGKSSEQQEQKTVSSSILQEELHEYESMIPESIKKESLMIWRTGSIQWSSDATVLVFPKKHPLRNGNCFYIQFNYGPFYARSGEAIMKIYSLDIKTNLNAFYKPGVKPQAVDYVVHKGEGYCANQYFIKAVASDSMYLINTDSILAKKTIHLFRQISAQEHFQTYALSPACFQNNKISAEQEQLYTEGKNKEAVSYQLPYVKPDFRTR